MNTEHLHFFELAYKERSFSAAARRVPCSPQGLTKAIRALEKELGVVLFTIDEATGLPVPTDYAHELFEFAAVYDSNVRLLRDSFARIRGQEEHEIRLSCSLGVIGVLGPEFLSGFAEAYPHIHVSSWEGNDAVCDEGVRDGSYDLALSTTPIGGEFVSTLAYRCPWCFWVNTGDPLAERSVLTIADLAGYDVAIPGSGYKCYDRLLSMAQDAQVQLGSVFEMSELFQIYEFVATGRGLGFTVQHLTELSVFQDPRVVSIPVEGVKWGFAVECLATHALSGAEQVLWDYAVNYAKRLPYNELAL